MIFELSARRDLHGDIKFIVAGGLAVYQCEC
jgi:hypothetical protein